MPKLIYLDNNATTKVHPEAIKYMIPFMNKWYGNCSSSHGFGRRCKNYLNYARKTIANLLGVRPCELIFCSGATEANNNCIRGVYAYIVSSKKLGHKRPHMLISPIEHASILKTVEDLKRRHNICIEYLKVDNEGFIDFNHLKRKIRPTTILITVMSDNNEIGTSQKPSVLKSIGLLCRKKGIHFHCDATQTIGHRPFYPKKYLIDSMSFSSHKFHGPRGIGVAFINQDSHNIIPCCSTGGSQEWGMRGGTENLAGIMGMTKALQISLTDIERKRRKIRHMREYLKDQLIDLIPGIIINGPQNIMYVKDNTLSICLPDINSRKLLPKLDNYGICMNIGSACSLGKRSHVLMACGLPVELEEGLLRISLSEYTTLKDCRYVSRVLSRLYNKYKKV